MMPKRISLRSARDVTEPDIVDADYGRGLQAATVLPVSASGINSTTLS